MTLAGKWIDCELYRDFQWIDESSDRSIEQQISLTPCYGDRGNFKSGFKVVSCFPLKVLTNYYFTEKIAIEEFKLFTVELFKH